MILEVELRGTAISKNLNFACVEDTHQLQDYFDGGLDWSFACDMKLYDDNVKIIIYKSNPGNIFFN